jgi:hypothetical protein
MCESLLSQEIAPKDRVQHFITNDSDGSCQSCKISAHSPGAVTNGELLARSIDFPLRKEPSTGGLNETLFQDAFHCGASAQRIPGDWVQDGQAIHDRYERRANNRRLGADGRDASPEWLYIGAVHVTANELRELQLETFRKCRVRVYDAAHTLDDPLHADVMVDASDIASESKSHKQQRKLLRVMLMNAAYKRGLFVSPHIASDDPILQNIQIPLHLPSQ